MHLTLTLIDDDQVSDDEDDTHPNIDTPSLFRWRHQARIEKMQQLEAEKKAVEEEKRKLEQEKEWVAQKLAEQAADEKLKDKLKELELAESEVKQKDEQVKKKEKLTPWNVDTLSKDGFQKTLINKPKPRVDTNNMTDEERDVWYKNFISKHESEMKHYGMLAKWDDCKSYLMEHPDLVCDEAANYLALWCLNLAMEEKFTLMEHISKQVISLQYILELAKQLDRDPRSCVSSFFTRIQTAEKEYIAAFEDELSSFKERIRKRAAEKVKKLLEEYEEEERQKRLGPGGLDPLEVFESLPKEMQECFESRDIGSLQAVISAMDEEQAKYHMKRCIDSGLWVPDANKAASGPDGEDVPAVDEVVAAGAEAESEPVYAEHNAP
jgi:cell division cycle protein 37